MSLPVFTFEVAFADVPRALAPTFTDLWADVETLAVTRGRQTEDDQAQTGTAIGVLVDETRKYDPNNTAGAFYPNVQPMKQLRVLATIGGTTYKVFRGWIDIQDGWVRDEGEPGRAAVNVPANDGFEIISNESIFMGTPPISTSTPLTGTRILNAMGISSYPSWGSDINAGKATMQPIASVYSGGTVNTLQAVRDAETTEPGFFYFDGNGFPCFRDRSSRPAQVSQATFCDAPNFSGARILYESATTRRSVVVTDAIATPPGLTAQETRDLTTETAYFRRSKSYSTMHVSVDDALVYTQWIVSTKKNSYELLESLTLTPGTDTAIWQQVLGRELNDRITVVRTPPGGGAAITQDYFIEQIALSVGPGVSASCTWRLSAAAPLNGYWLAGIVGSSEAGTTTKAGY